MENGSVGAMHDCAGVNIPQKEEISHLNSNLFNIRQSWRALLHSISFSGGNASGLSWVHAVQQE